MRKPFQGISNIIRFNWHFYVLVLIIVIASFIGFRHFSPVMQAISFGISFLALITCLFSLIVSYYVYDYSDLYELKWLQKYIGQSNQQALNISAGFDETTVLLKAKFTNTNWISCDFYDPAKHTEVSIKRARKAYPPSKSLIEVKTQSLPFEDNFFDSSIIIFAAHEIRDNSERIIFFKELKRITNPKGKIVVTEHLRDLNNFMAYNLGFIHFLSKRSWFNTFEKSGLTIIEEYKVNPFVTTYILSENGNSN